MALFEALARQLGCVYLSDLRSYESSNRKLVDAIRRIPLEEYGEREWIDAAQYFCHIRCSTGSEARSLLLSKGRRRLLPI